MATTGNINRTAATSINQQIESVAQALENFDDSDAYVESDGNLVNLWSAIKELEDTVEEVRKEVIESEMKARVNPGDRLCGVSLIQSHRKYIEEEASTVIGRAANRGIDWTPFVSINASTLAKSHPDIATVGRNKYTYFR